jgi:Bacterial CdiA-CT RNAse A domain
MKMKLRRQKARRDPGLGDDPGLGEGKRQDVTPDLSGSSSFYDLPTAESAVFRTLDAKQGEIDAWLTGKEQRLELTHSLTENIGITISKGTTNAVDTQNLWLLLRRDNNMPNGYRLQTGFPIK